MYSVALEPNAIYVIASITVLTGTIAGVFAGFCLYSIFVTTRIDRGLVINNTAKFFAFLVCFYVSVFISIVWIVIIIRLGVVINVVKAVMQ